MSKLQIYIFRHAQSIGNKTGKLQGRRGDAPLSENGPDQVNKLVKSGKLPPSDGVMWVYASLLERSYQTAILLVENHFRSAEVSQRSGLDERDYGGLTGRNREEIASQHGIENWAGDFEVFQSHGVESWKDICQRARQTLGGVVEHWMTWGMRTNAPIVIIGHGGWIRALHAALDLTIPKRIGNCEGMILEVDPMKV